MCILEFTLFRIVKSSVLVEQRIPITIVIPSIEKADSEFCCRKSKENDHFVLKNLTSTSVTFSVNVLMYGRE